METMNKLKALAVLLITSCYCYAQTPETFSGTFTEGVHELCKPGQVVVSPTPQDNLNVSGAANVIVRSATGVTLKPGFSAGNFISGGNFTARIESCTQEDFAICGNQFINLHQYLDEPEISGSENIFQIFDRFGNEYEAAEIMQRGGGIISCQAGYFTLDFLDTDPTGPNNFGFADFVNGANYRALVCRVFEDLSQLLNHGPQDGRVRIQVLASSNQPGQNVMAASASGLYTTIVGLNQGVIETEVSKTIRTGQDSYINTPLQGTGVFHANLQVNFGLNNWYWATINPAIGVNQIDAYTAILHEALHMLGIATLLNSDGTSRLTGTSIYSKWDLGLEFNNNQLLNYPGLYNINYSNVLPTINPGCTPSVGFNEFNVTNEDVHSPALWSPGSSLSHFNCIPNGCLLNNYVIKYCFSQGSFNRNPNQIEYELLCDLGYLLTTNYGLINPIPITNVNTRFTGYNACNQNTPCYAYGVNDQYSMATGAPDITINTAQNNDLPLGGVQVSNNSVQILFGGGGVAQNGNNIIYTPDPNFAGVAILAYIPECIGNNNTTYTGNITYIFIGVPPDLLPCPPVSCNQNIVCQGDFEQIIFDNNPATIDNLLTISNFRIVNQNSPDLYVNGLRQPAGAPTNFFACGMGNTPNPVPDPTGGSNYIGMAGYGGEAITLQLSNPMVPGQQFQFSFLGLGKLTCGPTFNFFISDVPPCPLPGNWTGCGFNPALYQLPSVPVPNNNWLNYQFNWTVPLTLPGNANFLTITGGAAATYGFIDNVSIVPTPIPNVNITSIVSNSNPCPNDQISITYTVCNPGNVNIGPTQLVVDVPFGWTIAPNADFNGQGLTNNNIIIAPGCQNYTVDLIPAGTLAGTNSTISLNLIGACVLGNPVNDIISVIPDILTIEKTITNSSTFNPGDIVNYQIRVCNASANPQQIVTNISLQDIVPNQFLQSTIISNDFTINGNTLTANVGQLLSGQCYDLTYSAQLDPTLSVCNGIINIQNCVDILAASGACNSNQQSCISLQVGATAFSVSTTQINVCNGATYGQATVIPSGGTPPYSYQWNNNQTTATATNLIIGAYSVIVTDANGCTASANVTISEVTSSITSLNINTTNISCQGLSDGTATVNPTPPIGVPPYSYVWTNQSGTVISSNYSVTGLGPGTYIVTVTDGSSCPVTASATFTDPPQISVSAIWNNDVCYEFDGGATAIVTGGTPPYTFQWTPQFSSTVVSSQNPATTLPSGWITVWVTDATGMCQAYTNVYIGDALPPDLLDETYNGGNTLGNLTFSGPDEISGLTFSVCGTLTINHNLTFSNCIIEMCPEASIVLNNCTLTVTNNTEIHARCNAMWNEIKVNNNSRIAVDNSMIKDAETAVHCIDNATLDIHHSVFDKDFRGVFVDYQLAPQYYPGPIYNNDFLCTTTLNPPHSNQVTQRAIELRGNLITAPDGNYFNNLDGGIYAHDGTLSHTIVSDNIFERVKSAARFKRIDNAQVMDNDFIGCNNGVLFETNTNGFLEIHDNNQFEDCWLGVWSVANNSCHVKVWGNNSSLPNKFYRTSNYPSYGFPDESWGIYGFNWFSIDDGSVYQIVNNEFEDLRYAININNTYGAYIAGNTIKVFDYPLLPGNPWTPPAGGISMGYNMLGFVHDNTVTGTFDQGGWQFWRSGIRSDMVPLAHVYCNTTNNIDIGLDVVGEQPFTSFNRNIMKGNHLAGININGFTEPWGTNIGYNGVPDNEWWPVSGDPNNIDSWSNFSFHTWVVQPDLSTPDLFFLRENSGIPNIHNPDPLMNNGANQQDWWVNPEFIVPYNSQPLDCSSWPYFMLRPVSEVKSLVQNNDNTPYSKLSKYMAYLLLKRDTLLYADSIITENIMLDSNYLNDADLLAFSDSMEQTTMGQLDNILNSLQLNMTRGAAGTANPLIAALNVINPEDSIEYYMKEMALIALDKTLVNNSFYEPAEVEELRVIAQKCPTIYGPGVFMARLLLSEIDSFPKIYLSECEAYYPMQSSNKWDEEDPEIEENTSVMDESPRFKLYPNPNNGNMYLEYKNLPENAIFTLYDVTGRKVSFYDLKGEQGKINISEDRLVNGIYIYRITGEQAKYKSGKIIINK